MRPWSTSGRLLPGLTAQRLLTQGPAVQLLLKTTSAETAEHVGIQKLKRFHMVNIKEFSRGISDQVISLTLADGCNGSVHLIRATSPKQQAPSTKLQAPSLKQQAKPKPVRVQASSIKRQAASNKLLDPEPFKKF